MKAVSGFAILALPLGAGLAFSLLMPSSPPRRQTLAERWSDSVRVTPRDDAESAPAHEGRIGSPFSPEAVFTPPASKAPSLPLLLQPIEAESDAQRRDEALAQACAAINDGDLPTVLASLVSSSGPSAADLRQLLLGRWAGLEAPAAAAWASGLPEGQARRQALSQVAITWADNDLAAARNWLDSQPEGADKEQMTVGMANEAAREAPLAALGLASRLSPSPERDESLVHAISQWAATDASAAVGWAGQVPDMALRQRLLGAALVASGTQDAPIAAKSVVQSMAFGPEQDRAAVCIVQRWAQQSPADATAWVALFPEGSLRQAARESLLAILNMQAAQAPDSR